MPTSGRLARAPLRLIEWQRGLVLGRGDRLSCALVTSQMPDWPREHRVLPAHLAAEAAANPGGSVAEIDGTVVTDPDGYVPFEAIIGCYLVGNDGRATGTYVRNPGHGPVRDDFARLEQPDHWLGWPARAGPPAIIPAAYPSMQDRTSVLPATPRATSQTRGRSR